MARRKAKAKPYYEQISEQLIKQLEAGTAPFQKPWKAGEWQRPYNPTTEAHYQGSNALWLSLQGRGDPRWMTYKQAAGIEAQVLKGEKGTPIQYWKFQEEQIRRDASGQPMMDSSGKPMKSKIALDKPRVFTAVVFNAEQIDGLPALSVNTDLTWQAHQRAEALLVASGVALHHGQQDRAFYRPSTDSIHLPNKDQFSDAGGYYSTAMHELGHWTGHASRLDRDLSGAFGSESYAKEELRAEIASLMITAQMGVGHDIGHHASYVQSWIKVLKDDPTEILRAAKEADQITTLVMSYDRGLVAEKSDQIMVQAELFAERFNRPEDRQRFMAGVQDRLDRRDRQSSIDEPVVEPIAEQSVGPER